MARQRKPGVVTGKVAPPNQREQRRLRLPGGVWARLDKTPNSTGEAAIWHALQGAVTVSRSKGKDGVFAELRQRAEPGAYRPKALPNIPEEQIVEDGETRTVIHSPTGQYLSLSPVELAVWHAMDGSRTLGALAALSLTRFKKLYDGRLIDNLREKGFLQDHSSRVYQRLTAAVEARSAEGWGRRLLGVLSGRSIAFGGIDRVYGTLYRAGGWLLFTPVVLVILVLLAITGLGIYLFVPSAVAGQVIATDGTGLAWSVFALYAALLVSFILHESAHALAVKHYDRTVVRGGVMLYLGMPAAFIDTSDMWRAQRWPRMVVSAAGPVSDLVVGGIATLVVFFAPEWAFSNAAYRLATMCYVATLFNLNPLLELDGYHLLVDLLRLPRLRSEALAFVRGPLWQKLHERLPFSREERIFAVYGLLAIGYTVVAIGAAALFWQRLLGGLFAGLWTSGLPGKLVAVALVVGVLIPTAVGLLLVAWGTIRAGAAYLYRHGYGRRPALLAAVTTALLLLVAAQRWPFTPMVATGCWALGLAALGALVPDYQGAKLLPALYALAGAAALGVASTLSGWLVPAGPTWLRVATDGLSLLLLVLAAFAALRDVDLRAARSDELIGTAVLLALAFVAGAEGLYRAQSILPTRGFGVHLIVAMPGYFGALALALLLPHLLGLRGSRLFWGWLLVWGGVLIQMVAYVLAIDPNAYENGLASVLTVQALDMLSAGLCAGGWLIQLATLRHIATTDQVWSEQPAISEAQRLQRALRMCYAGCYRHLRAVYGRRRAQVLDDRMDVLSATANWNVTVDRDRVTIDNQLAKAPLDVQGDRYAEVLRYTVNIIEELAGASFARRTIRAAYDALPWPEREAAGRRSFPDTPWAAELSSAFGSARDARRRLLRRVDLFASCDDDELAALVSVVQTQRVRAGQRLVAAGDTVGGIWIVEAGEIASSDSEGQIVEELRRGAYFRAEALEGESIEQTYRATIDSELLFLPALDLRAHLQRGDSHIVHSTQGREIVQQLERVPLFADIPRHTLRGLAMVAQREERPARSVIVREGTPSGTFYVIIQGQAVVIGRSQTKDDGNPGPLKIISQLGPEEFFGELELLRGTPPVASVVAQTPLILLALPHAAIAALLIGSSTAARNLEQVGTGRLIDLRQQLVG